MKRSILAGIAGYVVITSLTALSFVVMNAAELPLNEFKWLLIKLLIGVIGGLLGGFIAARIALFRPEHVVLILAAVMTILSVVAVFVMFGTEPLWFQGLLILLTGPAIWLGGRIQKRVNAA